MRPIRSTSSRSGKSVTASPPETSRGIMVRFLRFSRCGLARATSVVMVATLTYPLAAQAPAARFDSPIVSTQWLSEHLNDPNVVVLHLATIRRDYTTGPIPGGPLLWFNAGAPRH